MTNFEAKMERHTYTIEVEYYDGSSFSFDVIFEGSHLHHMANLMQVTRGTLMASSAAKATAYNQDGFDIFSYTQKMH